MVYLVELLPYAVLLIVMVRNYGILGAAQVWVVKTIFEFLAYTWLFKKYVMHMEPA